MTSVVVPRRRGVRAPPSSRFLHSGGMLGVSDFLPEPLHTAGPLFFGSRPSPSLRSSVPGFLLSPWGAGCLETALVSSGPPPPFTCHMGKSSSHSTGCPQGSEMQVLQPLCLALRVAGEEAVTRHRTWCRAGGPLGWRVSPARSLITLVSTLSPGARAQTLKR